MWNPSQYDRFKAERELPFYDLLGMLRRDVRPARVVDLGCGTGELTSVLHRELGAGETLGIDSSEEMLDRAPRSGQLQGLRFERHTIEAFSPEERFDLVWSNAALQWVDDHPALFERLTRFVAPGGQIAVQMPSNFDYPTHIIAAKVAAESPFLENASTAYRRDFPLLTPEGYAKLLYDLGYTKQCVRLQVYAHLLPSRDDVIEWVKGSLLTEYKSRLSPELYDRFLARYKERLLPELADTRPFFYPFKRLLIWGAR